MGFFDFITKPVASIAGSLIGGATSAKGARDANAESAASVEKQIAFQKESAQKGYQWATKDMRKAGLNPMLAYQQGGSQALSGASYTASNVAEAGVSSAKQIQALSSEMGLMRSQMQKTQNEAELTSLRQETQRLENIIKENLIPRSETQETLFSGVGDLMDDVKDKGLLKSILAGAGTAYGASKLKGLGAALKGLGKSAGSKAGSLGKLTSKQLRNLKYKFSKKRKSDLIKRKQWK